MDFTETQLCPSAGRGLKAPSRGVGEKAPCGVGGANRPSPEPTGQPATKTEMSAAVFKPLLLGALSGLPGEEDSTRHR